jgi:hypothetical protein
MMVKTLFTTQQLQSQITLIHKSVWSCDDGENIAYNTAAAVEPNYTNPQECLVM